MTPQTASHPQSALGVSAPHQSNSRPKNRPIMLPLSAPPASARAYPDRPVTFSTVRTPRPTIVARSTGKWASARASTAATADSYELEVSSASPAGGPPPGLAGGGWGGMGCLPVARESPLDSARNHPG